MPLSIIHQRALKLDGSHPTLLHGYGSYGITLDPAFDSTSLAWLERGGVVAVAHVRGGGEYGEDWHSGGRKGTKKNTITDFLGCAQYLIDHKYTSPQHLAGEGTAPAASPSAERLPSGPTCLARLWTTSECPMICALSCR